MGIEYSTPLVALTSAWFYISGEIVQISIRQKPKRRKRLSSHYVQGIWTGSLPHCLQLFPSRLAAWSSTNCLQRYIKNPELPSNSGVFCDNIVFSGRDSFSFTLLALRRERLYERE
ncbi:MAG: hypothetical protein MST01_07395 [Prevotella sp.]|nr:hypothetical protein [Prevotella sp.]